MAAFNNEKTSTLMGADYRSDRVYNYVRGLIRSDVCEQADLKQTTITIDVNRGKDIDFNLSPLKRSALSKILSDVLLDCIEASQEESDILVYLRFLERENKALITIVSSSDSPYKNKILLNSFSESFQQSLIDLKGCILFEDPLRDDGDPWFMDTWYTFRDIYSPTH